LVRRHNPSIVVDHGTALGLLYPFASIGGVPFVLQRHFPVRGFPHGKLLHRLQSIASRSRTIVALTEAIAAEMRTQGHRNVTVIPNVLPAGAHPAPYKDAIPRSALLMGRAKNPQKGFDLFLQALAVAKLEGWHFQIVGPEVDSDSQLLALVREHRLEGEVDLLPGNADPYLLLRNCSCLIMPSRYEGFPLVALEALSIGRPVLASDVDGLRDLVIPGTNGMLFHAEDVAELSAALEFVEKNPEQLGYFASNASESVKQYRGPIVVAKWCALVTRLTEQFNLREAHSSGPGSAEQTAAQGGSDG
jgi:glycosyltransferase involved in cell wall biosynthesis